MKSLQLILSNRKYFSVVWVFCSLNIMIGTWVVYIPQVKEKLKLDDSKIGFALFCLALGLLSMILLVPWLTRTIGLGKCTILGICLFSLAFIFPVASVSYFTLCISLFIVGMFSGFTDVAMNTLVSEIERTDKVSFMSSAHGFFSLGGAIGAFLGMVFMGVVKVPIFHMFLMATIVIFVNVFLMKNYVKIKEVYVEKIKETVTMKSYMPLVVLSILAMIVMGNEGAIEHWSSIYLTDIVKVSSKNLVGLGFTVFSVTMTIGRFFGDGISERIGSVKVIILGCAIAVLGYVLVITGILFLTVFGFGIIGLGLSVIVPELLRFAGKTQDISASKSIAFVSGIGFVGFLAVPVILGYISEAFTLKTSFLFLLVLTLLSVLLSALGLRPKNH